MHIVSHLQEFMFLTFAICYHYTSLYKYLLNHQSVYVRYSQSINPHGGSSIEHFYFQENIIKMDLENKNARLKNNITNKVNDVTYIDCVEKLYR